MSADMFVHIAERWATLDEFPAYDISSFGRIYNRRKRHFMATSQTQHGHVKVALVDDEGERYTRSVAMLVAKAFVEPPKARYEPDRIDGRFISHIGLEPICDHVIIHDGDFSNVVAENLSWRPSWFAWLYTRQLKIPQPMHLCNLEVMNMDTERVYPSIVNCGMVEGLLFKDIWRSTWRGARIYPFQHRYLVTQPAEQ